MEGNLIQINSDPAAPAAAPAAPAAVPARVVAPFAARHPNVVKAGDTALTGVAAVAAVVVTTAVVTAVQHWTRKWLRPARVPVVIAPVSGNPPAT